MRHRITIGDLRRRVILLSVAIVGITGVAVLAAALIPLRSEGRTHAEQTLVHELDLKAQAVSYLVQRARDVTRQVTSRSVIRKDLERFNDGQISAAELEASTTPRLADALAANADMVGIVRVDRGGRAVSSLGVPVPPELLQARNADVSSVTLFRPSVIKGKLTYMVGAPITSERGREGADFAVFNLDPVAQALDGGFGENPPYRILLVADGQAYGGLAGTVGVTGEIPPFAMSDVSWDGDPQRRKTSVIGNDDTEYIVVASPVADSEWVLWLYAESAALDHHAYDYGKPILAMILLVILGSASAALVLRPVTGKILVSAAELEEAVADRTRKLKKEIADHQRAERNLRDVEGRFQDIVGSMEEWVWEVDALGRYTYASPKVKDILGYTAAEIVGRTPFEFMDQAEASRIRPIFQAHVDARLPFHRLENANIRKDGRPVHVETTGFPLLSADGRLLGYRGVDRDVSERKRAEAAVRESETLYRTAFHTSPDAVNINRLSDGLFVEINHGFTAHTGYTRDDVAGRTSLDLGIWVHPEERRRMEEALRENGFVENQELQFRRKDGSLTTALMSAGMITIDGEPHILSITRDISERKKAETLLKESEARSRLLVEGMSIGFGIDSLEGRTIRSNGGLAKLLGYRSEELATMRSTDFTDPEHAERDRALFREMADGRRDGYQIEMPLRTREGGTVWGRVTRALVRDEQGRPEYCIAAIEDITGRKLLEQSLIQREAQISGILEASPAAIALKDIERRYLMVNAAYADFQGREPDAVLGRRAEDFQRPEVAAVALREDTSVLETGQVLMFPETRRDDGGRVRHFSVIKFPVWDRDRKLIGLGMIAVEVTREKQIADELRAAKERAEAANRTKTLFLANMSHELRTPLNSILGFSEMICLEMFGPLAPRYREYARLIRSSGGHLLGIINDILDMSRIESEKLDLDIAPIDISGLVEDSIVFLGETARLNNVRIATHFAAKDRIDGDALKIKQVFINVLSNAVKFSPGGAVTVSTEGDPEGCRVVFADNGIGMSDADIELALQPFGQAEQSPDVRRFQGTGLGLPIAKRLVELHGGSLRVESARGRGTTVTISLPRRPPGHAATDITPDRRRVEGTVPGPASD